MIFIRVHLKNIIRQFELQVIPRFVECFTALCYTVDKEFVKLKLTSTP